MESGYYVLSLGQVALAASLVLICALVSVLLQLGLVRQLAEASIRTVAQLLIIGFVLERIFALNRWYAVVPLMAIMVLGASVAAVRRTRHVYSGIWLNSLVSLWASSWIVTALALVWIVRVDPWYSPQYAIPLLGMVLGNTLNGVSLGLDRVGEEFHRSGDQIETLLALGATRWEAARDSVRHAVRSGMIPLINSMMVVGIVSLPGMMTGQILGGVDPVQAVRYQIVIMFLLATTTSLGTVLVVFLSYRRVFNPWHQFLGHRIRSREV